MVLLVNHSVDEMVRLLDGGAVINYQKHAVDIGLVNAQILFILTRLWINIHSATMMMRCLVHNLHYLKS